jgi:hypothetical protein
MDRSWKEYTATARVAMNRSWRHYDSSGRNGSISKEMWLSGHTELKNRTAKARVATNDLDRVVTVRVALNRSWRHCDSSGCNGSILTEMWRSGHTGLNDETTDLTSTTQVTGLDWNWNWNCKWRSGHDDRSWSEYDNAVTLIDSVRSTTARSLLIDRNWNRWQWLLVSRRLEGTERVTVTARSLRWKELNVEVERYTRVTSSDWVDWHCDGSGHNVSILTALRRFGSQWIGYKRKTLRRLGSQWIDLDRSMTAQVTLIDPDGSVTVGSHWVDR